jgi:hypothetical protein
MFLLSDSGSLTLATCELLLSNLFYIKLLCAGHCSWTVWLMLLAARNSQRTLHNEAPAVAVAVLLL